MKGIAGCWLISITAVAMIVSLAASAGAEWQAGVAALNKKDYATAIKEFEQVTQTNPDYAGAYYMLGLAQNGAGKVSSAVANARKAVDLDSSNIGFRVFLGQVLVQAEQYSEGYKTLKDVPISSVDAKIRSQYVLVFARAATKTNNISEAVRVLKSQIQADGSNASLYKALGEAHNALGDDKEKFKAFKKAFDLNPSDTSSGLRATNAAIAVARRATSESEKSRYYTDAAAIAQKVASASPKFEHILLAGEACLGNKDFNKALTWFDKAKSERPRNSLVRFYSGQSYSSLEKFSSALNELQEALALGATGKLRNQIYNQMGYVYAKQKDYANALRVYTEAGNSSKIREMESNLEKEKQNLEARKEQEEFERKLAALRLQISELRKIGQEEEADQLQEQLNELEKSLNR